AHPLAVIDAEAQTGSGRNRFTLQTAQIAYPHIMTQQVMREAQLLAVQADIVIVKRKIGYVAGSGDDEAGILRQCGYDVELMSDDSLRTGSLSAFGAIVIGPRAYNVRSAVRATNNRLLEYVRAGGTLVVQYQTPGRVVENIGPYPFKISSERVTDETAEMFSAYAGGPLRTIPAGPLAVERPSLRATDSLGRDIYLKLMTSPNALTSKDFDAWVQERGLSFATGWDARYTAPFICSDPAEQPAQGSLIVARYGKGYYCYTGLSLFRQLPAGVSGAFRLLSNLIELSQ
ncbi:MAG TPA: hypothetical protein VK470_09865, partial [Bacteroidota bacterium]|nr:hypothetical protein [Bacteroidota bacterium]